jgi:pimeloyl-ACP methyl ester carboxylesterase
LRSRGRCSLQILFSHGNAEDLSTIYHYFKEFSKAVGVNILAYDYTGYGKNRGEPSEAHVCADIEAAWQHLIETRKMRPCEVVLYGRSVGSGATCYLAQKLSHEGTPPGELTHVTHTMTPCWCAAPHTKLWL